MSSISEDVAVSWVAIAKLCGRSQRWCKTMAKRGTHPLPVQGTGSKSDPVHLNRADLDVWFENERRGFGPARVSDDYGWRNVTVGPAIHERTQRVATARGMSLRAGVEEALEAWLRGKEG